MTARAPEPNWRPSLGAWPTDAGTAFRVWAPGRRSLDVVVLPPGDAPVIHPLERRPDGTFSGAFPDIRTGDRYRYRLDGEAEFPDPASRFQPDGVHGPSLVVDPAGFEWTDSAWPGPASADLIFYELHVGTFSPEGTFDGVTSRLDALADLGVTAIELMPVADFPGSRNWGYDGAALFAPSHSYGTPDDLRQLVNAAHAIGLAVFLDVVYNHLGPDGAYPPAFSASYFTDRHHTPWGRALNFDGADSPMVREFFIENARHWVHEYHIDGLRLDATHAIIDDGPRPFLAELAARVHASATHRRVVVIAEDNRNLDRIVRPEGEGGWGLDGVWADDFHHECRRLMCGDREGYYRDYRGRAEDLAETVRRGWLYTGQHSVHAGAPRGTDPAGIGLDRFVICLQNHDQIGNRPFGDRLNQQVSPALFHAATAVLLTAPETPLLFMGQEWAASTPFLYFTDHHDELGRLVTEGRRQEFREFHAFRAPGARERIPDPQAEQTFLSSRLDWNEAAAPPHVATRRLYRALIALRRQDAVLSGRDRVVDAVALDDATLAMCCTTGNAAVLIVARLRDNAAVVDLQHGRLAPSEGAPLFDGRWETIFSTENPAFTDEARPPRVEQHDVALRIGFQRASAVILRAAKGSAERVEHAR